MNKKTIFVGLVIAAGGCAATQQVQRGDGAPMCTIESPRFPAAARDYDRGTTLDVLGNLSSIAAEDRAQLKEGSRSAIGGKLDTLATEKRGSAFISNDVEELATRLRQLDCAARAGMPFEVADQRYGQIIAELGVVKNILAPSGGSQGTKMESTLR